MNVLLRILDDEATDDRLAFRSRQAGMDQPAQPTPRSTKTLTTPDGAWTTIIRKWRPGDAEDCHLCPDGTCTLDYGSCELMVPGAISPREARHYSTHGMRRAPSRADRTASHPTPAPRLPGRSPGAGPPVGGPAECG